MAVITHFSYQTSLVEEYPDELIKDIIQNFSKYLLEEIIFTNKEDRPEKINMDPFENLANDKTYVIISSGIGRENVKRLMGIQECILIQIEKLKDTLLNVKGINEDCVKSLKLLLKILMRIIARQDKVEEDIKKYKEILADELFSLEEEIEKHSDKKLYYSSSSDLLNIKQRNNEQGYIDIANGMKKQIAKIEGTMDLFKESNFWSCDLDNENTDFTELFLKVSNKHLIETVKVKVFGK
tara:strand:- start:9934 stop:10650 length:717 start_codon:yes stop_codon:yes gene_type:complete